MGQKKNVSQFSSTFFKPKPIHAIALFIPITIILLSYNLIYHTHSYEPTQQQIVNYVNSPSQDKANILLNQESIYNTFLTQDELSHLDDVATLMNIFDYTFIITLAILTAAIITLQRKQQTKTIWEILFAGADLTLITIGLLTVAILSNFEKIFHKFHLIFFPQGNFAFPANSFLISNLPAEFFQNLGFKIFITAIIISSLLASISFYARIKLKPHSSPKR